MAPRGGGPTGPRFIVHFIIPGFSFFDASFLHMDGDLIMAKGKMRCFQVNVHISRFNKHPVRHVGNHPDRMQTCNVA